MTREINAPIGVFDSGIGGLSVLRALRAELPQQDFIYLADSGHAPYGERDQAHVIARSRAIAAHLAGRGVQALVVACNTATAAAIHLLRLANPSLPIIGVEPALRPAAALSRTGHIAVLATRGTLASVKFQALLATLDGQASYTLQACDGLADTIEHQPGNSDATEVIAACASFTRAAGLFGHQTGEIDTLVLGCTHYPFASEHFAALLPAGIQLVATGEAVARQTRRVLSMVDGVVIDADPMLPPAAGRGRVELLTTGQPQALQLAARHWLQVDSKATQLDI